MMDIAGVTEEPGDPMSILLLIVPMAVNGFIVIHYDLYDPTTYKWRSISEPGMVRAYTLFVTCFFLGWVSIYFFVRMQGH